MAAQLEDRFDKNASLIIRGAVVATGFAGFAIFARSIRLFTTFQHVRQIPDEFIRKQIRIRGTVSNVADDGILRIQHLPIFKLPLAKYFSKPVSEQGKLSIQLAGIEVTEAGRQLLKQQILWRPVWLTLIKRYDENTVGCEVLTKKGWFFKYSINKDLIRRGLARVPGLDDEIHVFAVQTNRAYSRLVHDLIICEKYADRRGVGIWHRSSLLESYLGLVSKYRERLRNNALFSSFVDLLRFLMRNLLSTSKVVGSKGLEMSKQLKRSYLSRN